MIGEIGEGLGRIGIGEELQITVEEQRQITGPAVAMLLAKPLHRPQAALFGGLVGDPEQ